MEAISPTESVRPTTLSRGARLAELLALSLLLVATIGIFGALFNRESVLSYSIGYNLYGAERVLEGQTPYRDFHTLYPPGTVYLNAALFRMLGVSLYSALVGVLVFKVLTTVVLFFCARRVMPAAWAAVAAAFSLIWLRPNGPFKSVPMHYGALFLALTLLLLLRWLSRRNNLLLLGLGLMLGLLALFKHNIGAYALAGSLVVIVIASRSRPDKKAGELVRRVAPSCLTVVLGFAAPIIAVAGFMGTHGALGQMVETLLMGPGEFLLGRLNRMPLPAAFVLVVGAVAICLAGGRWLRSEPRLATLMCAVVLIGVVAFLLNADQSLVDPIIFYTPIAVLLAGLAACLLASKLGLADRGVILALTLMAGAALMESFPRFAREQVIAAMPFVVLLVFYLLKVLKPLLERVCSSPLQASLVLAVIPATLAVMGIRLFADTYFDSGLRLKSAAELEVERGRGVYFPENAAREIKEVVNYVQDRVPEGGYFFPHSYAGSSYLFLANRRNPSAAQFWGGVGVTEADRAGTLEALEEKGVSLMITNEKDLAAERYQPMKEYIGRRFYLTRQVGDVLILERIDQIGEKQKGIMNR